MVQHDHLLNLTKLSLYPWITILFPIVTSELIRKSIGKQINRIAPNNLQFSLVKYVQVLLCSCKLDFPSLKVYGKNAHIHSILSFVQIT